MIKATTEQLEDFLDWIARPREPSVVFVPVANGTDLISEYLADKSAPSCGHDIITMSREEWGADLNLPRLGGTVKAYLRDDVTFHHTVTIDSDDTPNTWENVGEATVMMQRLQTIRPDLGLDVPYNLVAFCMADGTTILADGRGLWREAAHAKGKNVSSIGIAFAGNFEDNPPDDIGDRLEAIGDWLRGLEGFVNFAAPGPIVFGHRDSKATLCPGKHIYDNMHRIRGGKR